MSKDQTTLKAARAAAAKSPTWADLSNALFDPEVGLVTKAYPDRRERERFLAAEEYRAIRQLVQGVQETSGLVTGARPSSKSGKFVVRLPRSLHAALEAEADAEGVSLNQLVVTKLAFQLSRLTAGSTRENGVDCPKCT
jgi:NifB/MoaA-like Fe-S oxidoreductase